MSRLMDRNYKNENTEIKYLKNNIEKIKILKINNKLFAKNT